jgi:hypothetical protein
MKEAGKGVAAVHLQHFPQRRTFDDAQGADLIAPQRSGVQHHCGLEDDQPRGDQQGDAQFDHPHHTAVGQVE